LLLTGIKMAENKVEQYLIDLKYSYQEPKKGVWFIEDAEHSLDGVVIAYEDPLVIVRVQVMKIPSKKRDELLTKLLQLNATDLIHGAYGIEKDQVILIDTLEYATLDFGEFRATLDAFSLALTQHFPVLSAYMDKKEN